MADLARACVAVELGVADPAIAVAGFSVRVLDPAALWLVDGGAALEANQAAGGDPCRLWLAPGRALHVGQAGAPPPDAPFATEVTDGLAVFALAGARLHDVVAMGCTLDPNAAALAAGRCAQTLFGGVRVLLQPGAEAWRIYVDRPLAAFVLEWLRRSAAALDGSSAD